MKYILYLHGLQGILTLKLLNEKTNNIIVVVSKGYDNSEIIEYCINNNLKYLLREGNVPIEISRYDIDILISSSFQKLIHPNEYNSVNKHAINIHASILPTYKGKHSDVWALINGEKKLGVTVHRLNEKFDDGEILKIFRTDIDDHLENEEIYQKVISLLPDIIDEIFDNSIFTKAEQNLCLDIFWRTRTLTDSRIDWHKLPYHIFLFVRALSRDPIYAYSEYKSRHYMFKKVIPSDINFYAIPGTVKHIDNNIHVKCAVNSVKIVSMVEGSANPEDGEVLQ
jgi:methionyl-tRNA formyltransferase